MWCKLFVILSLLVTFDYLCKAQNATLKNAKSKADENRLKEVAEIRDKLNKAFEEEADKATAGRKGVIVQPEWTQHDDKIKGSTKVVVTQKKLKEAAAIRDEIQSAVNSDTYAKGESGFEASQVDHYLGKKFRSKNSTSNLVGSEKTNYDHEVVGHALEEKLNDGLPNVVESSAMEDGIDINKIKQLEMSTRRTREVLILGEIIEDLSFELGDDVKEWKHFEHNGQEYFIGLRDLDLVIIQKDVMKYEKDKVINVGDPIISLEVFDFWNIESRQQEGLVLAAVDDKVLWFQVNSETPLWQWSIGTPIVTLKYFKIGRREYLAISSKQSPRTGLFSLNIYQFKVKSKEFWISQQIQLKNLCSEITFLDTGRDMVIAAVQNNSAEIFTFNPRSELGDHIKFELKSSIQSEGIQSVSGFQMGGYSYLALGGLTPQILHYAHGKFVPKTIFGQNFGLVEMFFPIPARTYRDDLILLVQHRVDFESHAIVVLDALIWDGDVFEAAAPAPCLIGNVTFAYGVGCMLDVQRESGIKGSTVLKRKSDIWIIVPRHNAESGLFQLKIELLPKNSELLDLREIFAFLKEWVKEEIDLADDAHRFLEESRENIYKAAEVDFRKLASLKAPDLDFNGNIGEIFINDFKWVDEDEMQVQLDDLIRAIERLDMELSHGDDTIRNRRELSYDSLDFNNIEAEQLVLELLNGEQPYLRNSDLTFDGEVSFDHLKVLEEIRLSSTRFVRADSMKLEENLEFEEINGIKWKDLISSAVFRNESLEIAELQANGDVIVEGDIKVRTVNDLSFPDDYLWSSGSPASVVQAEKSFFGVLTVNALDTGGLINGVNPFDVITLSDTQNITGLTTFTQLEVSERMKLNGAVQGKGLTDFLSNPSLLESKVISSAVSFHHLEVRGPIFISEKLNDKDLDPILFDVVYRPSTSGEKISIQSKKIFRSVQFGSKLLLTESLLAGTPLKAFVTKNTNQQLDLKALSGNVYFNDLTVKGRYNSIDVHQLSRDSVHINEDRIVDVDIEFVDRIWAHSIDISSSLNGQESFMELSDNLILEEATFDDIASDTAISECDIKGNAALNNVHLKPGKPHQVQSSRIHVEELILESGLRLKSLHNVNATFFLAFLEKVDNIPGMILEGKVLVDHIHVDGDVRVIQLNGQSFDETIQSALWLNRPNFIRPKIKFSKPLLVSGDLKINGSLNEVDFPMMLQDIVFKSGNPVVITATKTFSRVLKVIGNSNIGSINQLPFTEIGTKETIEQFQGTVHINGDLLVDSFEATGFLNEYPIGGFGKSYRYDANFKSIVLLGEVEFEGHTNLENLHILGHLNSIGNVNEFFENIVYRNNICMLKGKTIFTGNVTIEKGAYIKNLNGYNVVQLMKNIVYINDPEPLIISAPVLFKDVVEIKDVTVKTFLNATNLMGCDLSEWMMDTLRVDTEADIAQLLHFGPGVLDNSSIYTVYLNKMDMEKMVTLHTPQNISGRMSFDDIYLVDSIGVGGLVNEVDLLEEMKNTLMIDRGHQHITTPLTMRSCTVFQCLQTNNVINGEKDIRNSANLFGGIKFHSPMFFRKSTCQNVVTNDLISGIDFDQWQENSLWKESRYNMVSTGNWTIKNLYVELPSGRDYGIATDHMQKALSLPNDEKREQYEDLSEAFVRLCQRGMDIVNKAEKRIHFLKHFSKSFSLIENGDINAIFSVTDAHNNYIIVNIVCECKIFRWDVESGVFKFITKFDSGVVTQIVAVPFKDGTLHLVTNTQSEDYKCPHSGVNSWNFNGKQVYHSQSFKDEDISEIRHPLKNSDVFFAIDEKIGKVLQLSPNSTKKQAWHLPPGDSALYRFMPHDAELGIALANGQQILVLNPPSSRPFRSKRNILISRQTENNLKTPVLANAGKELSFSDFRLLIERILRDLIRRLNIKLMDISFFVSEEGLQDEHLERDFMDLLEEIRKQKIVPSETFTDLQVELMEFSSNPVQILAATMVQVIWPVLGEVEEVHSHLRTNDQDHPICSGIFKSLSSAVRDILQIAKFSNKNQTNDTSGTNMTEIITRIQDFQREILKTIDNLEEGESSDPEAFSDKPPSSPEAPIQVHLLLNTTASNPLNEPFIGEAILQKSLLVAESPHLPARGAGEIVSIKTGVSGNYRTLIAITEPRDQLTDGEHDFIKIFFDVITGNLFQALSAYEPKFLTATRIQDESLLAFVEGKHTIRVLIYKGIQGFIEFVKFKVTEKVSGLNFISVPIKNNHGCLRHFLVVSEGSKVDFYQVIVTECCGFKDKLKCSIVESY